jgi:hypothetical protein
MPCPVGKFRATSGAGALADCIDCTAGFYCLAATVTPIICRQGFCPAGSGSPSPCLAGSYAANTGLTQSSDCTTCTKGNFCSQPGLNAPDGLCDIGYFCNAGQTTSNPTICALGGYCDMGSFSTIPCAPGTFNPNTGGNSEKDCSACTPGFYCQGTGGIETGKCYNGYYCTGGSTNPYQNIASKGYFASNATTAPSVQTACPVKKYNPYTAQATCLDCP